eukprot:Hpha_TRINITY_DN11045_c0_g1::TRINITY_DN11045_c0_g1_i2::g.93045::m.93045
MLVIPDRRALTIGAVHAAGGAAGGGGSCGGEGASEEIHILLSSARMSWRPERVPVRYPGPGPGNWKGVSSARRGTLSDIASLPSSESTARVGVRGAVLKPASSAQGSNGTASASTWTFQSCGFCSFNFSADTRIPIIPCRTVRVSCLRESRSSFMKIMNAFSSPFSRKLKRRSGCPLTWRATRGGFSPGRRVTVWMSLKGTHRVASRRPSLPGSLYATSNALRETRTIRSSDLPPAVRRFTAARYKITGSPPRPRNNDRSSASARFLEHPMGCSTRGNPVTGSRISCVPRALIPTPCLRLGLATI